MSDSARVGTNLAALVAARFVSMALSFVQMGIMIRALGQEGVGQFTFALNYPALFTVFATLGIQRLLVRDIARNPSIAWRYAWTALAVVVVLAGGVQVLVSVSAAFVHDNPVTQRAVMWAALSVVFLWAVQTPFEALITARERMGLLAGIYLLAAVLKLASVFVVLQLAPTSAGAHAAIAGANLVALLACVGVAIAVAGWERPSFELRLAFEQIRECVPFTAAALCSQLYFKSDVTLLTLIRGEAEAGLYGPVQRVVEPIIMIAGIWGTAVFPALCRLSVDAPSRYTQLKRSTIRLALVVALPMAVGIALISEPIIRLMAGAQFEAFAPSVLLLQYMTVIIPFFYFNGIAQEFFYAAHRNWFVVRAYALAAITNIGLNAALMPTYGVWALPIAAIAANFVIAGLFLVGLRREWGDTRVGLPSLALKTLTACGVMAAIVYCAAPVSLVGGIAAGAAAYGVLVYLFRVLEPEERAVVTAILRRVMPGKK